MIRLEGIGFAREDLGVLDGVDLVVHPGELVVIQGGRAAGKSALLAIAAARRAPDRGRVWISSREVGDLQRASLPLVRRNVSYLPAGAPLLEDESALENVMLALAVRGADFPTSFAAASRALEVLGLAACANRRVDALSASERRLVALARALAGLPPLAVLDDPASGLGHEDQERILATLVAAQDDGTTVLLATSDEVFAQQVVACGGRRARLEKGRLTGGLPGISLLPRRPEERVAPPAMPVPVGLPAAAHAELRRQGS